MARRFDGGKLVIASHNKGKLREIADLLRPYNVDTVSAGDLGLPEPEETGSTFVANAELKALASARGANLPALADDSGMSVDCLHGDPGIYSARWAGPEKDFQLAMRKVWDAVEKSGVQGVVVAQFVCVLTLAWPDGHVESFSGILPGQLVWPPRGLKGFGYDPMFVADGQGLSFGEMEPEAKHAISHRALAFRQLIDACFA
ncbi:RdgB/HAM1 family non-canonical purine NTP pyrophosphatase [Ferrovibrio sp. MS7]|uniref:RdgB/HAM1 family non-canonical purine NTP pyrophosphatase n=1 Tax=Ferrovibrio plantarum TaxID=3119164 RepID=UPI003135F0D9